MATTTLTPTQRAVRSTVALKALMAVSGLIMIGYLLAHMYGNLKVFAGQQAFDDYAHHLRTLGEPILPHSGTALDHPRGAAGRGGRARATRRSRCGPAPARPAVAAARSATSPPRATRGVQRTYASFTLRWGGIVIVLFVVYHLLHFTWNVIHPGGASDSPYQRVVNGFGVWWVVLAYTVAMIAVGFHLRHGTWSALTTLGANTSAVARHRLNLLAYAVAGVVTVGFLLPPYRSSSGW